MRGHYIIEYGIIREVKVAEWGAWFECAERRVVQTEVGSVLISTVFMGLDHRFIGEGPPLIFETMILGGRKLPVNEQGLRYSTLEEARAGHRIMVERVREFRPTAKVRQVEFADFATIPEEKREHHEHLLKVLTEAWKRALEE